MRQACCVVEAPLAHPDASLGEIPRLLGVADADADPLGGNAVEKLVYYGAAEPSRCSGDDDHIALQRSVCSVVAASICFQ